jgi:hypothetical protein
MVQNQVPKSGLLHDILSIVINEVLCINDEKWTNKCPMERMPASGDKILPDLWAEEFRNRSPGFWTSVFLQYLLIVEIAGWARDAY